MGTQRRGFSLIEAMIAAAVLGIGLIGLAQLHIASIQGTVKSEDTSRAAEVARELADLFATMPFANTPACGPGPNAPPTWATGGATFGCSLTGGVTPTFAANKAAGCTAWYTSDGVADVGNAGWVANPMAGDGSAPDSGNFRIDLAVSQHPDTANFPNAGGVTPNQLPVSVLWIWVCWRDSSNHVNEIQSARVLTPGL